jgi:N-acetylglucosaminyldiphosphoundecaprenol N-acetyl-beta-D-mannosaminyltransferase
MFRKHTLEQDSAEGFHRRFCNFTGVGIEALTLAELDERIAHWVADKSAPSHHLACLNAYCVALSLRDRELRSIYNRSAVAGADGMPFARWIQWVFKARCDQLSGREIVLHLAERAKETNHTFYLYGGAPEVLEAARAHMEAAFPHIRIVGAYSPPFRDLTAEEERAVCEDIGHLRPDIILVFLGTPKQDHWIDAHVPVFRGAVLVSAGAVVDFFGGRVKTAPAWITASGFEWVYRLFGRDFRRLWKRYTYYNLAFVSAFVLQLTGLRRYPLERGSVEGPGGEHSAMPAAADQ